MPRKSPSDLLTVPQAAKYLGISRQAVWEAIKKGRLETLRFGHVSLIPRASAAAYKKTRHPGGPAAKERKPKVKT